MYGVPSGQKRWRATSGEMVWTTAHQWSKVRPGACGERWLQTWQPRRRFVPEQPRDPPLGKSLGDSWVLSRRASWRMGFWNVQVSLLTDLMEGEFMTTKDDKPFWLAPVIFVGPVWNMAFSWQQPRLTRNGSSNQPQESNQRLWDYWNNEGAITYQSRKSVSWNASIHVFHFCRLEPPIKFSFWKFSAKIIITITISVQNFRNSTKNLMWEISLGVLLSRQFGLFRE